VPTTDGSLVGTTYQPGLYTSQISITGGADYTFASGIYYLEQGISLDGSGTIMGNNVFFYITGGSFGIGGAGRVTLGPLSSPPSPASGMVIWQTDSDATQVDLHGTASGSVIGGTIYAPNADVDIAGGGTGSGLQIGALLASQVSCNGGGGGKPVFTISGEQ
jgi:hypothetical protein